MCHFDGDICVSAIMYQGHDFTTNAALFISGPMRKRGLK
jgi:hypothetical protein